MSLWHPLMQFRDWSVYDALFDIIFCATDVHDVTYDAEIDTGDILIDVANDVWIAYLMIIHITYLT